MVDVDSVASVIDTSAIVRMNASWESKLARSIVTQALGFSYHTGELHQPRNCGVSRSLFWTQHAAELERDACR
jgi:hypothetical protein